MGSIFTENAKLLGGGTQVSDKPKFLLQFDRCEIQFLTALIMTYVPSDEAIIGIVIFALQKMRSFRKVLFDEKGVAGTLFIFSCMRPMRTFVLKF